jgi:hypothetical protein
MAAGEHRRFLACEDDQASLGEEHARRQHGTPHQNLLTTERREQNPRTPPGQP